MTRVCHYCKLDWNVSKLDPGGKVYICPVCERKRRSKNETPVFRTGRGVRDSRMGADPARKEG